jgi:hypothetical protein
MIDFTGWKYTDAKNKVIVSPDGRHSRLLEVTEVADWLAAGGVPDAYVAPEPTWQEKRQANVAGGGYGEVTEQLEIIGEQGITAFQNHIAAVKSAIPKP